VLVLADNGRYVLAESGPRLLFFERRILPSWTPFVSGLLAVIAVANAVLLLLVGSPAAAGILAALGVMSAVVFRATVQSRRRARARPLEPSGVIVQLDLAARSLLDGAGHVLAALTDVRVERRMQLASSARALTIVWPGRRLVVYRGDPLSRHGGIQPAVTALATRGIPTG
jgi:hypothetical protein